MERYSNVTGVDDTIPVCRGRIGHDNANASQPVRVVNNRVLAGAESIPKASVVNPANTQHSAASTSEHIRFPIPISAVVWVLVRSRSARLLPVATTIWVKGRSTVAAA